MATRAENEGRVRTRVSPRSRADLNRGLAQSHGSYELVLSPILLGLGGWWLDGRLGTGPLLVVICSLFGVVGAVTKLVLEYRNRMATHTTDAEAQNAERLARHAEARAAREAERAELESLLAEAARAERDGVSV